MFVKNDRLSCFAQAETLALGRGFMSLPIDLSLFEGLSHSPSFGSLTDGLGEMKSQLKDYCIPVNPYFPTAAMFHSFRERLEATLKFYPAYNETIADSLAKTLGLDPETIVMGNGSTELITWINHLFIKDSMGIPIPTFSRWTEDPLATGKTVNLLQRPESANFSLTVEQYVSFMRATNSRVVVLCNPNNPTGAFMEVSDIVRMMDALADRDLVVIDESFVDFVTDGPVPTVGDEAVRRKNVIVLKSLGKNFGLHGVRAGYVLANPQLAQQLRKRLPYWNLNAMAEMLVRELPFHLDEYELGRRQVVRDRKYLEEALGHVGGLKVFPSQANFVFFRVPDDIDGTALRNHLLTEHGCLTRECGNKVGTDKRYFRVAARPRGDTDRLVRALTSSLSEMRASATCDCLAG